MKRGRFIYFTGVVFFVFGLLMIGISGKNFVKQKSFQKETLNQAKVSLEQVKNVHSSLSNWSKGDIIGILKIPSLQQELAIIEGTNEDELDKGVGHYLHTALPDENDQILLSGHRDIVFRQVGELVEGDELVIVMNKGAFRYKITDTYIVASDNRSVIRSTSPKEILTLSTCYPFSFVGNAPQRYIIEAARLYEND